jgi:hypothetical protein
VSLQLKGQQATAHTEGGVLEKKGVLRDDSKLPEQRRHSLVPSRQALHLELIAQDLMISRLQNSFPFRVINGSSLHPPQYVLQEYFSRSRLVI